MARKAKFNKTSINKLPDDKPVLYRIKTDAGNDNYVGIAHKGRVKARLAEHLGEIPGATVEIERFGSVSDARAKEKNVIKRSQPKYNNQDK